MNSQSDDLDSAFEAVLSQAESLEQTAPDERATRLQNLISPDSSNTDTPALDSPWTDLLQLLFDPDQKPCSVQKMLQILRNHGYSKNEGIQKIALLLDQTSRQTALADWKNVTEREELRIRLKVLADCESLLPELIPFLMFFFRSSNPLLYREAALAIGSHISSLDGLVEQIQQFASRRNISLDQPISLNGERGRRRLLLVRVATLLKESPCSLFSNQHESQLPFALNENKELEADESWILEHLPDDPSDLSILYDAVGLLYQNDSTRDMVSSLVSPLLKITTDNESIPISRSLLRRWGVLLSASAQRHAHADQTNRKQAASEDNPIELWFRIRQRILNRQRATERMAPSLKRFFLWNELIRTILRLPADLRRAISTSLMQQHADNGAQFDLLQLWNWADRENEFNGIDEQQINDFLSEQCSPDNGSPIQRAYQSLKYRRSKEKTPIHQPETGQIQQFRHLLDPMTNRDRWLSQPTEQRALTAFLLMDLTEYTLSNRSEILPLFRSAGFSDSFQTGSKQNPSGLKPGTIAVLLRLLNWEDQTFSQFLDVYFLHRIENPQVLLALLPTDQDSPILSLLADAFEQFVRLNLYRNPSFDAGRYLLRTSIRNPHPAFYEALLKQTCNHTYEQSGTPIPINQWIESIRDQALNIKQAPPSTPRDKLVKLVEQHQSVHLTSTSPSSTLDRLQKMRDHYADFLGQNADPRKLLERFRQLIGHTKPGSSTGTRSLLSLIKQLQEEEDHLLQSGHPARSDHTFQSLSSSFNELNDQLQERTSELLPNSLENIDELTDTVEELKQILTQYRATVGPVLPVYDQRIFETIIDLISDVLSRWMDSFHQLLDAWYEEPEEGEWNRDLARVFSVVESRFSAALSRDLLKTIWNELWTDVESSGEGDEIPPAIPETEDSWSRHRRLLDWGLDVMKRIEGGAGKTELIKLFYESWSELLRTAMERGQESRVNQLLQPKYEPLYTREEADALMEDVESWQFDRYQLPRKSRRFSDVQRFGQLVPNPPILSFLAHLSPVWLSLMAGAIFLLDFGEPWTEMARIKDLRGILITFLVGVVSTYLYLFADLRRKVNVCPEDSRIWFWCQRAIRLLIFLAGCLIYTFVLCSFFWFLLSRTDQVVHGPWAIGHIVVWTGFALFIGIFLGLLANQN